MREFLIYLAIGLGAYLICATVNLITLLLQIKAQEKKFGRVLYDKYELDILELYRETSIKHAMTFRSTAKYIAYTLMYFILWPVYITDDCVRMIMIHKDFDKKLKQLRAGLN